VDESDRDERERDERVPRPHGPEVRHAGDDVFGDDVEPSSIVTSGRSPASVGS
jgi:hypothetical protein